MRLGWLALVAVVAVGCESLRPPALPPNPSPGPSPTRGGEQTPAPPSLPGKGAGGLGSSEDDQLTLAAKCLERGDEPAACAHLDDYVRAHPEQIMFRAHLAELLFKLDRTAEAKAQFEKFVADAQEATGPPRRHLVHCHTRLMELAQRADDRFAEVFHRGVGLLLVAEQLAAVPEPDEQDCEQVLCKALKALAEARELRPADPRVSLYLADVYDRMGNRRGADAARAAARSNSTPGSLTPAEQRRLALVP